MIVLRRMSETFSAVEIKRNKFFIFYFNETMNYESLLAKVLYYIFTLPKIYFLLELLYFRIFEKLTKYNHYEKIH